MILISSEGAEPLQQPSSGNKSMRTNHVLIDLENVQLNALTGLDAEHFRVLVFVGANQAKLSFDLVAQVQKLGSRASYIKIAGNGNNALDFHIAYYIGKLAAEDPLAYFHIISKDTGFDPLIQYLKGQKIGITRCTTIGDIPLLKVANSKTQLEKIAAVITNLQQRGLSKPRTVKTLSGTISNIFQKELAEEEINSILAKLESSGVIAVKENKISYALPEMDTGAKLVAAVA